MALSQLQKAKNTTEIIETIEFKIEHYKDLLTQFGDNETIYQKTKAQYKFAIRELEHLLIQIGAYK